MPDRWAELLDVDDDTYQVAVEFLYERFKAGVEPSILCHAAEVISQCGMPAGIMFVAAVEDGAPLDWARSFSCRPG